MKNQPSASHTTALTRATHVEIRHCTGKHTSAPTSALRAKHCHVSILQPNFVNSINMLLCFSKLSLLLSLTIYLSISLFFSLLTFS